MLPSRRGRAGKHTVDDCAMYRNDWNGLQRHAQRILVWNAGAQDEDPWEYNIALRKGLLPHSVRGVHASLPELSYLRIIRKNDGVTLITHCRGENCPRKRDSRQPEFPNTVDSVYKSC